MITNRRRNIRDTATILAVMAWMIIDAYKITKMGYLIGGIIFGAVFVIVGGFIIREIWRD